MSREQRLQQLLKNPRIWKSTAARNSGHSLSTGFEALDARLNGGWPVGVLTELLVEEEGAGELSLLMPALARLSSASHSWIAWVSPPHIPYAPALSQHGVDVSRLLVARPESPDDVHWTLEQTLRSDACAAVLGWIAAADDRVLRRLQLAAEAGHSWAVIVRHSRFCQAPSPAPLRIALSAGTHATVKHEQEQGRYRLSLDLLRNRYGLAGRVELAC